MIKHKQSGFVAEYTEKQNEKIIKLQAKVKRLEEVKEIAKIKLGAIEIRAKDRRPLGSKGDKPIWIIAKNGLKAIEQALKAKKKEENQ